MKNVILAFTAVALCSSIDVGPAAAQQNEQFLPALVYRTGPYAPNGIPFADGVIDYWTLLNERDGGINGVKIVFEECETGYDTAKGVECYERLKAKGSTGAGYFSPLSTGITFALTEKVPGDKIPLLTMGYGRSESRNGAVFPWNFIAIGSYWTAADVAIQRLVTVLLHGRPDRFSANHGVQQSTVVQYLGVVVLGDRLALSHDELIEVLMHRKSACRMLQHQRLVT